MRSSDDLQHAFDEGMDALRRAVLAVLSPQLVPQPAGHVLLAETAVPDSAPLSSGGSRGSSPVGDEDRATSSEVPGSHSYVSPRATIACQIGQISCQSAGSAARIVKRRPLGEPRRHRNRVLRLVLDPRRADARHARMADQARAPRWGPDRLAARARPLGCGVACGVTGRFGLLVVLDRW